MRPLALSISRLTLDGAAYTITPNGC